MTKQKPIPQGIRLRIRVVGIAGDALGPGKAQLLEEIAATGSLRQAATKLGMSYMKAWRLANAMNSNFRSPLLEKTRGGGNRGGTKLTPLGEKALETYHRMTALADQAARTEWKAFSRLLKK